MTRTLRLTYLCLQLMFRSLSIHSGNDHSRNGHTDHFVGVWGIQFGQLDSSGISCDLLRLPRDICPTERYLREEECHPGGPGVVHSLLLALWSG